MKTKTSLHRLGVVVAAALGLTLSAVAQQIPTASSSAPAPAQPTSADDHYGLIGDTYSGLRFGYEHRSGGVPETLHRYGFVSNKPLMQNIDTSFNYDFRSGGTSGTEYRWHDVGMGFTGFLSDLGAVRPFLSGNLGWRWQRIGGARDSSFRYVAGTGAEVLVAPRWSVAPYVNYAEAPHLHDHAWTYGANTVYHVTRTWSGLLGAEAGEHRQLNYFAGVNRHF